MKSFQLLLLCFVCVAISYGQAGRVVIEITKAKHKVYTIKVVQLDIPRADSSWGQSFEKDLNRFIPVKNRVKKGKYLVSADFIRDKEGGLVEVKCENDPGFGIRAEIVRALKKSRKWAGPVKVRQ
jgi:protein TonB